MTEGTIVMACVLTAALIGSTMFLSDHEGGQVQFLADRPVRPAVVWLTRQMVTSAVACCAVAVVLVVAVFVQGDVRWSSGGAKLGHTLSTWFVDAFGLANFDGSGREQGFAPWLVVLGFFVGQWCSLNVRGGLMAGALSLMLTLLVAGWAGLMFVLDVPRLWSVAPIPLVLLFSTWLRVGPWMLARDDRRTWWLTKFLPLAVPAVALAVAVPIHRATVVPAIDPGYDVATFYRPPTRAERETVELYRKAVDGPILHPHFVPAANLDIEALMGIAKGELDYLDDDFDEVARAKRNLHPLWLVLDDESRAWVEANSEVVSLAIEASQREFGIDYREKEDWKFANDVIRLGRWAVADGLRWQEQGELERAWERYIAALRICVHLHRIPLWDTGDTEAKIYEAMVSWATAEEQTVERIAAAIEELREVQGRFPSKTDAIKADHYRTTQRVLALDDVLLDDIPLSRRELQSLRLAKRLLPWEWTHTRRTADALTRRWLDGEREVEAIVAGEHPQPEDFLAHARALVALSPQEERWYETTALKGLANILPGHPYISVREAAHRRAAVIRMAIVGWEGQTGRVLESLDDLVPEYLAEVPPNPYTGQAPIYLPDGVERFAIEGWQYIPPRAPLLWMPESASDPTLQVRPGIAVKGGKLFAMPWREDEASRAEAVNEAEEAESDR